VGSGIVRWVSGIVEWGEVGVGWMVWVVARGGWILVVVVRLVFWGGWG